MSYSVEDILARMRNGESTDDIAAEMAKALNEARVQKEEEDAVAAEAKERDAKKFGDAGEIAACINEFVQDYYPDFVDEAGKTPHWDAQDIVDIFDNAIEFSATFSRFRDSLPSSIRDWFPEDLFHM